MVEIVEIKSERVLAGDLVQIYSESNILHANSLLASSKVEGDKSDLWHPVGRAFSNLVGPQIPQQIGQFLSNIGDNIY
jgi:hypothetical protein